MKPTTFKNFSDTFVFDTNIPGPTLTIFGGIHGDETAGIETIDYLIEQIGNHAMNLLNGKLILAYGNQVAMKLGEKGTRQDIYNMNRTFKKKYLESISDEYEIQRTQQLAQILDQSDILLDIHSTSSKSDPFIFAEDIGDELAIAKSIFSGNTIVGWEAMAKKTGIIDGDTNGYMHVLGKTALTLECGNHKDAGAAEVGKHTATQLLGYLGMIDNTQESENNSGTGYEMYGIETKTAEDFKFAKAFRNFTKMQVGDLIYSDAKKDVYAQEEFTLLLPNKNKDIGMGKEVFYYGREV